MMRILLANDDGIDAPGLALLERAAREISDDVWVVAPSEKRTAAGHSLTIARPLTMIRKGERRYSCSGTPADCVLTAMTWLFGPSERPDLVLSGVNDGKNVGEDIGYSGTLGVAREATFWGIPAIAFSRVKTPVLSERDGDFVADLITKFWRRKKDWLIEGHWLSVNLPAALPAPLGLASIGRDKVGVSCEVVRSEGPKTELIVPRGRQNTTKDGDENDALARGIATVSRLKWAGETALPPEFLNSL